MIRPELTIVLSLSLIAVSWESPFSQHHSPYTAADHNLYSALHKAYSPSRPLFEPDARYRSRHDHDEERWESRHSNGGGHRGESHHQPLSHSPVQHSMIDFNLDQNDPLRNKRQAFLPYFPYYSFLPPVYQVHNIILTPPGYNCYPSLRPGFDRPPVERPPPKRPDNTSGSDEGGLGTRLGDEDTKNGTSTTGSKQAPSKCVWSIVACCSPGSRDIRYACFELLGCPGAFWDVNPCDERVVTAAANSALRYYMNNQSPTPEPSFQNL